MREDRGAIYPSLRCRARKPRGIRAEARQPLERAREVALRAQHEREAQLRGDPERVAGRLAHLLRELLVRERAASTSARSCSNAASTWAAGCGMYPVRPAARAAVSACNACADAVLEFAARRADEASTPHASTRSATCSDQALGRSRNRVLRLGGRSIHPSASASHALRWRASGSSSSWGSSATLGSEVLMCTAASSDATCDSTSPVPSARRACSEQRAERGDRIGLGVEQLVDSFGEVAGPGLVAAQAARDREIEEQVRALVGGERLDPARPVRQQVRPRVSEPRDASRRSRARRVRGRHRATGRSPPRRRRATRTSARPLRTAPRRAPGRRRAARPATSTGAADAADSDPTGSRRVR